MPPFNNHKTPQEIPADRNRQGPSTSRPTTSYNTTTSSLDTTIQQSLDSTGDTSGQEPPGTVHVQVNDARSNAASCQDCTICSDTVRRRLRSAGLRARRPHVGTVLTDRHRNERRRWTGRYRHWWLQRWHGVLFSDESSFRLRNADGRLRVWRRRGVRCRSDCLVQTDRWGAGSVIVWNRISYHHRTALHVLPFAEWIYYRDNVLRNHVILVF